MNLMDKVATMVLWLMIGMFVLTFLVAAIACSRSVGRTDVEVASDLQQMSREQFEHRFWSHLQLYMGYKRQRHSEKRLIDSNFSRVELIELVDGLEDDYGFEVGEDDFTEGATLQDVCDVIWQRSGGAVGGIEDNQSSIS